KATKSLGFDDSPLPLVWSDSLKATLLTGYVV
ncbi:MAG: hypothetical protein ACI814_005260, partial [Mariniblastus sp.]